jgi:hypothetical protein
LATPWRLTLAVTVYQERDPQAPTYLRDPVTLATFTEPDEIRDHLLAQYIPAVTKTATRTAPYSAEEIHRWLGVLARYLTTNATRPPFAGRRLSSTDLVPHELWPLAGHRPRYVTVLIGFLMALLLTVLILCEVTITVTGFALVATGYGILLAGAVLRSLWRDCRPEPARVDLTQLRSPARRRQFVVMFACVLVTGPVIGLVFGFLFGLAFRVVVQLAGFTTSGVSSTAHDHDPNPSSPTTSMPPGALLPADPDPSMGSSDQPREHRAPDMLPIRPHR